MKNKFIKIFLPTFAVLSLAACSSVEPVDPSHEHTYSTVWSYDESNHWHTATCGHESISDKATHTYGNEWIIEKECTTTTDGLKYQECTVCGYHNEVIIEKGSQVHTHTYSENWSYNDEYHWHEGTCGHNVVGNKEKHSYGAWAISLYPTSTSEGIKIRTCEDCGYEQQEIIPELEDDYIPLSLYKISYYEDDEIAKAAAKELNDAFGDRVLGLQAVNSYVDESYLIHLKSDSTFEDEYELKINNNALILTSDTTIGLIEGAKDILEKAESSDEVITYYPEPIKEGYSKKEQIKTMTYNVRSADDNTLGNGDSGNVDNRLPRVAVNIRTFMPDTVAVQEATDKWISGLKEELGPEYGYLGYGRDANYKGESSGIFYNRDTVTLLESATKWFSDTPDVSGSHFPDYDGYNRLMSYGIFKRNSDGYIYMHVSTHMDLKQSPNAKNARKLDELISPYKGKMPIIVSGDFNCHQEDIGWAYDIFMNELDYVDSKYQALDNNKEQFTYSQVGYKKDADPQEIIDFILLANNGIYFDKYLVDTTKYQGPADTRAQLTSDHYAVYTESTPYEPLIPFDCSEIHEEVEIDDGFAMYDHHHDLVNHESQYHNVDTAYAYLTEFEGDLGGNNTNYQCITNFTSGETLDYVFNSASSGTGDLSIALANKIKAATGTNDLSNYISVSLNGSDIDVSGLNLRCSDIRSTMYEWENLVLRGVDILEGENTLTISSLNDNAPYQLSLDIFSNLDIEPVQIDELSKYKIYLGAEELTLREFKDRYPNIEPTICMVNTQSVLTLSLADNSSTTFALAGSLDLTYYDQVYIDGNGELIVDYDEAIDGIVANNLTIEQGSILSLSGYSATEQSGVKVHGTLQIDGTLNVDHYGNAIAIDYSESPSVITNVGPYGTLNVTDCKDGIHAWNAPSGSSINIAGEAIFNVSQDCIELACILPINFNNGAEATFISPKAGINVSIESADTSISLNGDAHVSMNISTGSGIFICSSEGKGQGSINLRDNSSLEINAGSSGLYGFSSLNVNNGTSLNDYSKNSASLKIHAGGNKGSGTKVDSSGRTPDGNPIQGRSGATYFTFDTTGEVLIEKTGDKARTAIHLGGSSGKNAYFRVFATNMTIKNCSNAIGCWVDRNWTVDYDYESTGCAKVNIVNCTNIYSGNSSPISTIFTSSTCNVTN